MTSEILMRLLSLIVVGLIGGLLLWGIGKLLKVEAVFWKMVLVAVAASLPDQLYNTFFPPSGEMWVIGVRLLLCVLILFVLLRMMIPGIRVSRAILMIVLYYATGIVLGMALVYTLAGMTVYQN